MPDLPAQCESAGVEEAKRRRRRRDGGWRGQREARREAASVGPRIARDGPPATAPSRRLAAADETPERRIGPVAPAAFTRGKSIGRGRRNARGNLAMRPNRYLPRASAVGRIACSHSQASAKDRDFQGKGGKMRDRQTDMDHAYRVLHAIVDTCQFQSSPLNSWDLDAHAHIRHKSVLPASVIAERNVLPFPSGSASSGRDLWLTMPPEKIAKRRS